jgi:hypothetical protein
VKLFTGSPTQIRPFFKIIKNSPLSAFGVLEELTQSTNDVQLLEDIRFFLKWKEVKSTVDRSVIELLSRKVHQKLSDLSKD